MNVKPKRRKILCRNKIGNKMICGQSDGSVVLQAAGIHHLAISPSGYCHWRLQQTFPLGPNLLTLSRFTLVRHASIQFWIHKYLRTFVYLYIFAWEIINNVLFVNSICFIISILIKTHTFCVQFLVSTTITIKVKG